MKVLIACEESQEVCKAFRALGHEAYSCDLQECSGGHPEWHIQDDALKILNGCRPAFCFKDFNDRDEYPVFKTMDGHLHKTPERWDLIIAHPPCTDLAVSGARHFAQKQKDGRQQKSIVLFMQFALAVCDHVAIENPVGIMSSAFRKPDQIIQPYQFGHPYKKTTCLWLKGLPKLSPTEIVEPEIKTYTCKNGKTVHFSADYGGGGAGSGKRRSKTYPGIARAMAEQWGEYITKEET